MGTPINLWNTGLQGVSVRTLQILRGRYCKAMLLSEFNRVSVRFKQFMNSYINVTPTFRTDFTKHVNGLLSKDPSKMPNKEPAKKKRKCV